MGWMVNGALVVLSGVTIVLLTTLRNSHRSCVSEGVQLLRPSGEYPNRVFPLRRTQAFREARSAVSTVLKRDGFIDSVSRSKHPSLDSRSAVSVPQTIWQTARSHNSTPTHGTDMYNSWTRHNPEWDHLFLDDDEVDAFVAAHYNQTVLKSFRDMPLGVMRADVFRCARRYAPFNSAPVV